MFNQPNKIVGNVPNPSENFGNVPHDSETFGSIPKDAETFRIVQNDAERTEQHTLTVREVARLFENAGVPRTERSIINWCQPNRQGIARLDAFFDTNERKYFVTPQSVTLAISEEQAKQPVAVNAVPSESAEPTPKHSASAEKASETTDEVQSMRLQMRDLEITNRVKDQVINLAEKERERLMSERENYVRELMSQSYQIGRLEAQMVQLSSPSSDRVPNSSDGFPAHQTPSLGFADSRTSN